MSQYFFDTSALVKRYHLEPGSSAVAALFAEPDGTFCVSRLALVETVSAFSLKVRVGEIGPTQLALARTRVLGDVKEKVLQVARLLVRHLRLAEALLLRYGTTYRLRTLDAVQLAVALDLFSMQRIDCFVSSDTVLCQIALEERLHALNPMDEQAPS